MTEDRRAAFDARVEELRRLDDDQLTARFWELANALVVPIVDLARTHTSPSIERSILLRMGIDSVSSHGIVDRIAEAGLLGKGAGHVLVRLSRRDGIDLRAAGQRVLDDAGCLDGLFAPATPSPTTAPDATGATR